ncbi:MAG: lysostaphin resistance A-like protein [Jatrophihabitans sp.]|uniref:CPBP family intramembrane glutamic endopeptidase n=1 Tax=Jatrophihabitans sp. TaxID=1932789 RepID=UPI003F7F18C6
MTDVVTRVRRAFLDALVEKVPRDHTETDAAFRRRRIVSAITLVVGAALLGISLSTKPGDVAFYPLTASVAVVWVVGGLLSGPLHLGWITWHDGRLRRPVMASLILGALAAATFVVGALIVRQIGPLRRIVADVLHHASAGNTALVLVVTLANGLAEEVFFRGALFAAIGRKHAVVVSTVIYALATIATLNPMLVFAAVLMGTLFGLQRRASGGILGPMITHVVWSTVMLLVLPPLLT